jgi:multiple antibiotic resistance protein
MALSMLRARADTLRTTENEAKATEGLQSVTVVPLAIPLLAGPGAISTVHVWP